MGAMWCDVVDLRDFYQSPLGQMARQLIRVRLRAIWPDVRDQKLLGVGYATPYLRQFHDEAERVIAIMPAQQGVLHWPPEGPNAVTLADETELPLPDVSMDRVLLVHGLECSEHLRDMLREIWRVMTSSGRLLIVVPNRRGIWSRTDRTPFGQGHPYSPSQLSRLLRDNNFTPIQASRALFIPPLRWRALLRTAAAWERIGTRLFPTFAGVVIVEAGKQIYPAAAQQRRRARPAVVLPFPQTAAGLQAGQRRDSVAP
jgi:SAM-dependent methyltransferase